MPEGPTRRVTSRDVAQAAGVSQSAVSLVLTDKWRGRISAETADRIHQVAAELAYWPNLAARSLRLERTGTVLLIIPTLALAGALAAFSPDDARLADLQGLPTFSFDDLAGTFAPLLALATELVCVLRYKFHYFMATGIHSQAVKEEFLEHANEEQEHADRIAERIKQLGGKPEMNPAVFDQLLKW